MARYRPKRLDTALPGAKPRPEEKPGRLALSSRHPPTVRLLLLTALLILAVTLGGTLARYVKDWSDSSLMTAGNFYFTSEELNDGLYHRKTDPEGRVNFSFTLKNYVVARYPTQSEIAYTCTVKDDEGSVPGGVQWRNDAGDLIDAQGTLPGDSKQDKTVTCSIPAAAFGPAGDRELTVTVRATKPYAVQLTARLTLSEADGGVTLVVTDPGAPNGAVSVTLYNTGGEPCTGILRVKNNEDQALAIDRTFTSLAVMDENGKVTLPAQGALSVVFLKKNMENRFSKTDFEFKLSQGSA